MGQHVRVPGALPEYEQFRSALSQRIAQRRRATGQSQYMFCDELGISRAHYGQIERGDACPSLEYLFVLLPALGCTIEELLMPGRSQ